LASGAAPGGEAGAAGSFRLRGPDGFPGDPEPLGRPAGSHQPAPEVPAAAATAAGPGQGGLPAGLAALGVPAGLAALARDPDRYTAVLRAMRALPPAPAPPSRPGDVLVLLGEPVAATAASAQLAELIRVDPTSTLIVTPNRACVATAQRVQSLLSVDREARRMSVDDLPNLVVVDAPVTGHDPAWTAAMVQALRPTATWAVVDATRKPADLARYLRSLGAVDALAVHATGASGDPATVLQLGVPVAWLDGRPATAGGWAGLLCERLAGE
jgi:hypothetical protein